MEKTITIKDIAREAGVSETTISRYLNQKYEYMSEKTRKKIEEVIKELDYRPNNVARSLKSQKSRLIGAVIADISNPFSPVIIKGLSDKCEELGYTLMIAISDESAKNEQMHIEKFIDNQVEGLIINTSGDNEEYLNELNTSSLPIILLDRGIGCNTIDTVTTDNYTAGVEAMDYLVDIGYQSVGFFVDRVSNTVREHRLKAFEESLVTYPSIHGEVFIVPDVDKEKIKDGLRAFKKSPAPRVIFAANGFMTLSILEVMKSEGYIINEDMGICGFDDLTWAKVVTPEVTTIAQNSYTLGTEACTQLIHKIEHKKQNRKPKITLFPGELIVRGSTKVD